MNNEDKSKDKEIEIEKKFLVLNDTWKSQVSDSFDIYQAYFVDSDNKQKRIRVVPNKKEAVIAYKEDIGVTNGFIERIEIEHTVDYEKGLELLLSQNKILNKNRSLIQFNGLILEVDVFLNLPYPLTMVEVEVKKEQINESIDYPEWFGEDVSLSTEYRNAVLVEKALSLDLELLKLQLIKQKIKI